MNNLVVAISQNKETYKKARIYLLGVLGDKDLVLKLEDSRVDICIPYYINYIESCGVTMLEAIEYFYHKDNRHLPYWELLKVSIIGVFRKLENNDFNYVPF